VLRAAAARGHEDVATLTDQARGLRDAIAESVVALAETEGELAAAQQAASRVEAAEALLDRARACCASAVERDRLTAEVRRLHGRREAARQQAHLARQMWLDLREQRLTGMAAELAGGLQPGEPCLVCGSAEHPAPAQPGAHRVSPQSEQEAADAADQAARRLSLVDGDLAAARAALAAAAESVGRLEVTAAAAAVGNAETALAQAQEAGRRAVHLQRRYADLTAGIEAARHEEERTRHELTDAGEAAAVAHERVSAAEQALASACGDDADPRARRLRLERSVAVGEARIAARASAARAAEHLASLRNAAAAAARGAGFQTLDAALAALLQPEHESTLVAATREYEEQVCAVSAGLARDAVASVAGESAPDLTGLCTAAELAASDDEAAAARVTLCLTASRALDDLVAQLTAHLAASRPLVEAAGRLHELSRCVDGTGGDNARRMTLSAFVLAARLEQVAQAASERLAQMSGGRYTLVHCDDVEPRGRRGGLSLRVVDGWTGTSRATASLSGGESFYASLALALGLADVVSAEAAGTSIDTLFVDEGFGSLDADTLEEVMDALDALRAGGRAVGLVSHVPDLQQRIPARLEVVKGRGGSTLRLAVA
jgi:exonuclease SbcC